MYGKDIKYPTNGDGPFRFVYGSPSFVNESRILIGVFVYEINDDYKPQNWLTLNFIYLNQFIDSFDLKINVHWNSWGSRQD